jgi:hypothetical protein
VRCDGTGGTTSDGTFDYARCASDPAFATCHAEACAGHRRAQAGDGSGEGTCSDLESRSAEVTQVCCDEPEEDCTGGYPHSCNADCAATFLPFWEECRTVLGQESQRFESVVAICTASAGSARPSLAQQLSLQCTDGTAAANCVPECSGRYHGYLMLLNINGDDSKLSCELQHGRYSWVGASVCNLLYLGLGRVCFRPAINCPHMLLRWAERRWIPGLRLRDLRFRSSERCGRDVRRDARS